LQRWHNPSIQDVWRRIIWIYPTTTMSINPTSRVLNLHRSKLLSETKPLQWQTLSMTLRQRHLDKIEITTVVSGHVHGSSKAAQLNTMSCLPYWQNHAVIGFSDRRDRLRSSISCYNSSCKTHWQKKRNETWIVCT
jgi:hypothetical protein